MLDTMPELAKNDEMLKKFGWTIPTTDKEAEEICDAIFKLENDMDSLLCENKTVSRKAHHAAKYEKLSKLLETFDFASRTLCEFELEMYKQYALHPEKYTKQKMDNHLKICLFRMIEELTSRMFFLHNVLIEHGFAAPSGMNGYMEKYISEKNKFERID